MMRLYLQDKGSIAYFQQAATPDFWDDHWAIDDLHRAITTCQSDGLFVPAVKRYLPPGSIVLEGGCGRGQLVHALTYQGYRASGIDFAVNTVERINQAVPTLDIRLGDIRQLPIPDNSLDGYISVGVIEHFWEGYHPILEEMQRTIRPGGFLFISFPQMSLIRRIKVAFKEIPVGVSSSLSQQADLFYQFALPPESVIKDLENIGFTLKKIHYWDGVKGLKDEIAWLRPILQPIYDGKFMPKLVPSINYLTQRFAAHCVMLVLQMKED